MATNLILHFHLGHKWGAREVLVDHVKWLKRQAKCWREMARFVRDLFLYMGICCLLLSQIFACVPHLRGKLYVYFVAGVDIGHPALLLTSLWQFEQYEQKRTETRENRTRIDLARKARERIEILCTEATPVIFWFAKKIQQSIRKQQQNMAYM